MFSWQTEANVFLTYIIKPGSMINVSWGGISSNHVPGLLIYIEFYCYNHSIDEKIKGLNG